MTSTMKCEKPRLLLVQKSTPQSRGQACDDLFSVFLEGAGIQDTQFFHQEEVPESCGQPGRCSGKRSPVW